MTCRDCKDLMMACLDNEMNETDKRKFEEHLGSCVQCAREMEEFKKLKCVTDGIALAEPEDRVWDQYWGNVYNRMERGIGWVIFSVAAILLLIYAGFLAIERLIADPGLSILFESWFAGSGGWTGDPVRLCFAGANLLLEPRPVQRCQEIRPCCCQRRTLSAARRSSSTSA